MKKLPSNEVLISKEHMSQLKELPFTNVKDFNKGKNVIVLHNIKYPWVHTGENPFD